MEIRVSSVDGLQKAALELLAFAGKERVFLFFGDMGAGKTTFIKEICKALGAEEAVSSPTFSIVNEYESAAGLIYHFDFYRLKQESEALDLGYEDYFYSGNYCFAEWPEKISGLLPERAVKVSIEVLDLNQRLISANKN